MREPENRILRSSLTISFFTFLTSAFNYLSLAILALAFGARKEMDAFFSASTIPQIILAVLFASLFNTFIPVFIETKNKDESRAWKIASISTNLLFLLLCTVATVGYLFSERVISLINPGFSEETTALAASLLRILLLSSVFSGISLLLTSQSYALHKFLRPSLAQGVCSLITFLFVLGLRSTQGIKSIAFGTLAGSLVQLSFLLPLLFKKGRYSFEFDFKKSEIIKLTRLTLPLLIGSLFYKTNSLVERFIASGLGEGTISFLGYANKIITTLLILTTQGLSTALFPRMSEYSAKKDFKALKETLSKGLRALMIVVVPATFFIILARHDFVRLIFERGDFTPQATQAVGNALVAYVGFFVVGVLGLPMVNTLYSLQETTQVAKIGIFGFSLYVCLAFVLSRYYGYMGIALATSIQYVVNLIFFSFILKKRVGRLMAPDLLLCIYKTGFASLLSCLVLLASQKFVKGIMGQSLSFLTLGSMYMIIYFLLLKILKTEELRFLHVRFSSSNKIKK